MIVNSTSKILAIVLLSVLFSCKKHSSDPGSRFEKQLLDSINRHQYKAQFIRVFPDWEATGYFKNAKLKAFKVLLKPEIGTVSNLVYLGSKSEIKKMIFETHLPVFSKKPGDYKLVDSIFEMEPTTGQVIRYKGNTAVDTINDAKRIALIVKQMAIFKSEIQHQYKEM